MQVELTAALRQKDRLASLGAGVAKVSHDLRNILASAQLFADRLEETEDPTVRRLGPKIVASLRAPSRSARRRSPSAGSEEPPPRLGRVPLAARGGRGDRRRAAGGGRGRPLLRRGRAARASWCGPTASSSTGCS